MTRPISPRLHGVLDYATAGLTVLAPTLLRFPPSATRTARALAAGYTGLSLVTNYPLSARRVVPFPAHGITEGAIGLALPFLPRLLGFRENRRATRFFLGLAALTAVVAALTDWTKEDSTPEDR